MQRWASLRVRRSSSRPTVPTMRCVATGSQSASAPISRRRREVVLTKAMHSPAVEGPDSTELARARAVSRSSPASSADRAPLRMASPLRLDFLERPHAYSFSPQLASAWRGTRPDQGDTAAGSLQPAASRRIRFKAGCTVSDWPRCSQASLPTARANATT